MVPFESRTPSRSLAMTTWIQKLANAAPDRESFSKLGLSEIEIDLYLSRYRPARQDLPLGLPDSDPILSVFDEWDLSSVKIGQISFHQIPLVGESGEIEIGQVEADPLIVCRRSEVIVREFASSNILWRVASNSTCFLNALIPAAEFLGKRGVGLVEFDDFDYANEVAEVCATHAGGQTYRRFFQMLLGTEE